MDPVCSKNLFLKHSYLQITQTLLGLAVDLKSSPLFQSRFKTNQAPQVVGPGTLGIPY